MSAHAIEAYGGAEIQFHPLITSADDGHVYFTPRPLYFQQKCRQYPLKRSLDECQRQDGCSGKEGHLLPLPRIKPQLSGCVAHRLVTTVAPYYYTDTHTSFKHFNLPCLSLKQINVTEYSYFSVICSLSPVHEPK